nr:hypothetical protein [Tanacetum cinerariifolium]
SAKHVPSLANPKPKAPKLKPSDVTKSDQGDNSGSEEGDGSGSKKVGDEEEDEKKADEEEDEKEGDEEEDEKDGDEEEDEEEGDEEDDEEKGDKEEDKKREDDEEKVDDEEDEEDVIVKDEEYEEEEEEEEKVSEEEEEEEEDVNVKRNKRGRKGKGEVVMSKGKKIKVEDKEAGEKKRKKDYEPSFSEDEKPLKKKTKGKGKGPSKPMKKGLSDNQIRREKFLSNYLPLLSRIVPSSFFHAIRDGKVNMKSFMKDIGFFVLHSVNIDTLPNCLARFVVRAFDSKTYNFYLKTGVIHVTAKKVHEILGLPIDTMRAFVNLLVVRRIREETNIAGVDWCDFIHCCLATSHEPNTISGFYNGPLCFLI